MTLEIMSGPPLPARNTHGSIKGRSLPPPPGPTQSHAPSVKNRTLPPLPQDSNSHTNNGLHHGRVNTLPARRPSDEGQYQGRPLPSPPIDYENSPHDNHRSQSSVPKTASLKHSPSARRPLPPAPTEGLPHSRSSPVLHRRPSNHQATPPPSLPVRKSSLSRSCEEEFESKFLFHGIKDFPPPEECQILNKRYPSKYGNKNW